MAKQSTDPKTKARNKGRDDREARSKAGAEEEEIEQATHHEKRQAAEDPSKASPTTARPTP